MYFKKQQDIYFSLTLPPSLCRTLFLFFPSSLFFTAKNINNPYNIIYFNDDVRDVSSITKIFKKEEILIRVGSFKFSNVCSIRGR